MLSRSDRAAAAHVLTDNGGGEGGCRTEKIKAVDGAVYQGILREEYP